MLLLLCHYTYRLHTIAAAAVASAGRAACTGNHPATAAAAYPAAGSIVTIFTARHGSGTRSRSTHRQQAPPIHFGSPTASAGPLSSGRGRRHDRRL